MTGTRRTVSSFYKLPSSGRGRRCRLPADPIWFKGSRVLQLTSRAPFVGGRQIRRGAVVPCHACACQRPQSSAALIRRVATALHKRCNQEEMRQLSVTNLEGFVTWLSLPAAKTFRPSSLWEWGLQMLVLLRIFRRQRSSFFLSAVVAYRSLVTPTRSHAHTSKQK